MRVSEINKQEFQVLSNDETIISGINIAYYRPWIYPFCSPSGINVLREFPPDHGFHNGGFFGHYPVISSSKEFSFWATPPLRTPQDSLANNIGRIAGDVLSTKIDKNRCTIRLSCAWYTHEDKLLLTEIRKFVYFLTKKASTLQVSSAIRNVSKSQIRLAQTKYSGHAYRIGIPLAGTVKINNRKFSYDTGLENAHEMKFENNSFSIFGKRVCIRFKASKECYFFARKYGFFSMNPFYRNSLSLNQNEEFVFLSQISVFDLY